nr:ribonuclease H-like domain-containing protein [Tanacetum cinerariifolium]
MKLMQFLIGLDNSYMQIRSFILSREVLPDVKSAYATISSEESHRIVTGSIVGSSQRNQASAFVSNVPNRNNFQRNTQNLNNGPRPNNMNNNRQGGGSGLVCENCGFYGRTIDRYFKIIGHPADFGKKKFNQSFKGKNVSNSNSVGSNSSIGFTNEQMTTLISLIKDNKKRKNVQANMSGFESVKCSGDCRSEKYVTIGYSSVKKDMGYIVLIRTSSFRDVKFFENIFPFKDLDKVKNDTANVFQDVNHINFFDLKYPEIPNDDERVDPKLNSDNKSQSASSSFSESGRNSFTVDFSVNSENDADSSDNVFATQDERVITLE